MTLLKIGMAAVAALFCSAAQAETAAPAKLMQLAQAKKEAQACPMMLAPVCGVVKGKPTDFNNECEAARAKAKKVSPGPCLRKG